MKEPKHKSHIQVQTFKYVTITQHKKSNIILMHANFTTKM